MEGSKRSSAAEFGRFLNIAEASAAEALYLIEFSRDLGYVTSTDAEPLLDQADALGAMLHRLRLHLRRPKRETDSG